MKIILFGLGKHYKDKKRVLLQTDVEIIAATDNNSALWGTVIDDISVVSPKEAVCNAFDYIVITNKVYYEEIRKQLLEYDVPEEKVIGCNDFLRIMNKGMLKVYLPAEPITDNKKKVLFITPGIGYHGASMAILYAAVASISMGYAPTILCAQADFKLIEEYSKKGITFWKYPNIMALATKEELFWIPDTFTKIIANTLPMARYAVMLKEKAPTVLWIHETLDAYNTYASFWNEIVPEEFDGISVYAVTEHAKRNFHKFFPGVEVNTFLLGIPDEAISCNCRPKEKEKTVFAVVGGIESRKGQDVFLAAAEQLGEDINAEFWLIGRVPDTEFTSKIEASAKRTDKIKILGLKNREEMKNLYKDIDVFVVSSREETLSIVAIEAFINKKLCIVSDACGIVDYLKDSVDSFIFPSENVDKLAELMKKVGNPAFQGDEIRNNGRATYEKYFSMNALAGRLQDIL